MIFSKYSFDSETSLWVEGRFESSIRFFYAYLTTILLKSTLSIWDLLYVEV